MPETATHVGSGKVRELFELHEERLLLVASDRISTFDVVLPTEIPDKGRVLTGLSGFWFARTREVVPNHLLGLRPDGRSTECRRLEMLPLEPRLDEREQHALAEEERVNGLEIAQHPVGPHLEPFDEPGEPVEHVVEREEGIGNHYAFGR